MAEYIEREKALAFQNELEPCLCRRAATGDVFSATKDVDLVAYLQSIPAADVRPVVLCRDCKYAERTGMADGCIWCNENLLGRLDDDFCSRGEKTEES